VVLHDEEIGRGAHHFDVAKFGADWAYTMDGSQIGELEYENFNAAGAKITFKEKRTSWLCQRKNDQFDVDC
jgi:tripeptide aminopeptidase